MGVLFRLCLFGTCGALCGDMSCLLFGWFTCSFTNELQTGLLPDDFERGGQCGTRQLRTLFFLYRCEIRNRNTRSTIFFFWSFRVDPGLTHGHLPSARECTRLAVSFCHHVSSSTFKFHGHLDFKRDATWVPPQPCKEDRKASEAGWI